MLRESDLLELVALLYQAAHDPSLWPVFLEAYAKVLTADMAALQVHKFDHGTSELLADFGLTSSLRSSYNSHYAGLNLFREKGRPLYRTGRVLFDEEICSRATLEQSTFYNEFLIPLGGVYSASGVIERRADKAVVITALRGRRRKRWGVPDLKLIRLLLPHVTRARAMGERVGLMAAGIAALDGLDTGVVFVRAPADVVYSNGVAEKIFKRADGLSSTGGLLRASDSSSEAALHQAILGATGAVPLICPTAVPIARQSLRRSYQVVVSPLVQAIPAFAGIPSPHAMLIIVDPDCPRAVSPEALGVLYGLTGREASLASLLSAGSALQAAAGELGMEYETARSHLKRIFEKTGTSRQAELIVLLSHVAARVVDATIQ